MKKILIVLIIINITSCQKRFHFSPNEITETDINANLVGNINQNDWKLNALSNASTTDLNIINEYANLNNFNINAYKSNCNNMPVNYNFISYPNPMQSNCILKHKIQSDFNYVEMIEIIADKNGHVIQSQGLFKQSNWTTQIPVLVKRDFIYYGIFITSDSCLYFTKGNVIGCTK